MAGCPPRSGEGAGLMAERRRGWLIEPGLCGTTLVFEGEFDHLCQTKDKLRAEGYTCVVIEDRGEAPEVCASRDRFPEGPSAFCPNGGCPETVLCGGERVPAGCARDFGWTPVDGDAYPVSLAAVAALRGR